MTHSAVNPFYSSRRRFVPGIIPPSARVMEKRVIGTATLYRADCFDVLPSLSGISAVVTDPPYGIGFHYRSYDDAPERYGVLEAGSREVDLDREVGSSPSSTTRNGLPLTRDCGSVARTSPGSATAQAAEGRSIARPSFPTFTTCA